MGVGIQGVSVGPDGELLDADGFTIVQKGGRYGRSGAEGSDSGTFAAITPEFEETLRENPDKKKARELPDFYRFQFRERKRQRTSKEALRNGSANQCYRVCLAPHAVRGGQGQGRPAQGHAALQAVRTCVCFLPR